MELSPSETEGGGEREGGRGSERGRERGMGIRGWEGGSRERERKGGEREDRPVRVDVLYSLTQ